MKCLPSLVVFWFFLLAAPVVANIAPFCFHRLFFFVGLFLFCGLLFCWNLYLCAGRSHRNIGIEPSSRQKYHLPTRQHIYFNVWLWVCFVSYHIFMCACAGDLCLRVLKIMYIFSTFACFVFAYRVWRSFTCNSQLEMNVPDFHIHSDMRMLAVWLAGWLICCEIVVLLLQWLRAMRRMSNISAFAIAYFFGWPLMRPAGLAGWVGVPKFKLTCLKSICPKLGS